MIVGEFVTNVMYLNIGSVMVNWIVVLYSEVLKM
jgi:hypothetical protein